MAGQVGREAMLGREPCSSLIRTLGKGGGLILMAALGTSCSSETLSTDELATGMGRCEGAEAARLDGGGV